MHNFVSKFPIKPINKVQNFSRFLKFFINNVEGFIGEGKMINVDVEVDSVATVVGGREGVEAPGE
ncbi:hypothetical protein NC652_023224 [Populus alba x Populus x berolinensis]|nr:hypothetical protein NC652_023224 [Populus alba x Populus x berolinensis]